MKGTEQFKVAIESHLNQLASKDELFAETLKKPNKTIDECIDYIIDEVKKSGKNGFADAEIFGMAVHYYDEDELKAPKKSDGGRVVVNHTVELSPEDIEQAKKKAIDSVVQEQKSKLKKPEVKNAPEAKPIVPSLFD